MYGGVKSVLLREYPEQGQSKEPLTTMPGINRRTIPHWISTDPLERELGSQGVQYEKRQAVDRNVERYRVIITSR